MCIIWIKLSRWLWKPLGQLISDVHFINNLLQIYFSSTLWIITNNYLYYHASFLDIIIPGVSISLLQGTWVPWSWFTLLHFLKPYLTPSLISTVSRLNLSPGLPYSGWQIHNLNLDFLAFFVLEDHLFIDHPGGIFCLHNDKNSPGGGK